MAWVQIKLGLLCRFFLLACASRATRLPFQTEAPAVPHQPVQNGVCNRRITKPCEPMLYRKLVRDDGRPLRAAVVNDLQQVCARACVDRPRSVQTSTRVWPGYPK